MGQNPRRSSSQTMVKITLIILICLCLFGTYLLGYIVGSEGLLERERLLNEEICCLEDIKNKPNICVPAKCASYLQLD